MKVGDLVWLYKSIASKHADSALKLRPDKCVTVVVDICSPTAHRNGMYLIQVVEDGSLKWYPSGHIEVINDYG